MKTRLTAPPLVLAAALPPAAGSVMAAGRISDLEDDDAREARDEVAATANEASGSPRNEGRRAVGLAGVPSRVMRPRGIWPFMLVPRQWAPHTMRTGKARVATCSDGGKRPRSRTTISSREQHEQQRRNRRLCRRQL